MRYMLRNVARDRSFERRRRSHPGETCMRPVIGGKPLPPGATRLLQPSDLSARVLEDIERHQAVGNVVLLAVGRGGREVVIRELREQLGIAGPSTEAAPAPPAPAPGIPSAAEPSEPPGEPEPVLPAPDDSTSDEPLPPDPAPMRVEDVVDPDPEPTGYTEAQLLALTNSELREVLAGMGAPVTGKNKAALVAEVLAHQAGG